MSCKHKPPVAECTEWTCDNCGKVTEAPGKGKPSGWFHLSGRPLAYGDGYRQEATLCRSCTCNLVDAIYQKNFPKLEFTR